MPTMKYSTRVCDVCGSTELETINSYQTDARTRTGIYNWHISNVVCQRCGFAFVSPRPSERSLNSYYADSFPFWQGDTVEFSIEKRIEAIGRLLSGKKSELLIEIGPNAWQGFGEAVKRRVGQYIAVDPNAAVDAIKSTTMLRPATADVVVAYWVFEHVADPNALFAEIQRLLKPDGVVVIEVPDLLLYPADPVGIMHFEHLTHFSSRSLAVLAARHGLELIDANNEDCSRLGGFFASFRKTGQHRRGVLDEYEQALFCMSAGARCIVAYREKLTAVRAIIHSRASEGARVVFWAASKTCADLLQGLTPRPSAVFVDSDPTKRDYLAPLLFITPTAAEGAIRAGDFFVICSELHSGEIAHHIARIRGKPLEKGDYIVLSPGFAIGRGPARL